MKSYLEFIKEEERIIHQTSQTNFFNKIFDTLNVDDYIKLNKKGGDFLGYYKIIDIYNANRSLPGDDTMEVALVDVFGNPVAVQSTFPIIKEDMSYEYSKLSVNDYNCVLFEYNDKYLLIHPVSKEKNKDYEIIKTLSSGNFQRDMVNYILKLFGIRYNETFENIKQFQIIENDILKVYNYSIINLNKKSFEIYFDKYKLSKNDINGKLINEAEFFKKDKAKEIINHKFIFMIDQ